MILLAPMETTLVPNFNLHSICSKLYGTVISAHCPAYVHCATVITINAFLKSKSLNEADALTVS
jgi:hypothetical protein